MSKRSIVVDELRDYWTKLPKRDKAAVRGFIARHGYTEPYDLLSHMYECGVARRFSISRRVMELVIQHYQDSSV